MAVAVIPTPDDLTIISPLIQFGVGAGLLVLSKLGKKKK